MGGLVSEGEVFSGKKEKENVGVEYPASQVSPKVSALSTTK